MELLENEDDPGLMRRISDRYIRLSSVRQDHVRDLKMYLYFPEWTVGGD